MARSPALLPPGMLATLRSAACGLPIFTDDSHRGAYLEFMADELQRFIDRKVPDAAEEVSAP